MKDSVLLFGGNSEERLVSVASAQNLARHFQFGEIWFLHKNGPLSKISQGELLGHADAFQTEFKTSQPSFASDMKSALPHLKDKAVFLALHGTEGEDGVLQALFESAQVAFTGSGSESSRKAFVKTVAKEIVSAHGVQLAPELVVESGADAASSLTAFFRTHGKVVLKPLANGSSIGLHIITDDASLAKAIAAISSENYGPYLAEKFIEGRELTVGVCHDGTKLIALPPSEIILQKGHSFDYQGKYLGRGTIEVTPAEIGAHEIQAAQTLALAGHKALGCYGYSRTDMMMTTNGMVFLETNTLPGLSKMSFVPQQLVVAGTPFKDFIEMQLTLSSKRY
jgi:D-alanine-D-alanine ligase